MSHVSKGSQSPNENNEALLLLMKPGVWYCSSDYDGCKAILEGGDLVSGKMFAALVKKGFVEGVPVFEGFMTKKLRITDMGIAWLAAR